MLRRHNCPAVNTHVFIKWSLNNQNLTEVEMLLCIAMHWRAHMNYMLELSLPGSLTAAR
jgi:hypothetical protein